MTFLPGAAAKSVPIRFRFLWTLLPPVEVTENKIDLLDQELFNGVLSMRLIFFESLYFSYKKKVVHYFSSFCCGSGVLSVLSTQRPDIQQHACARAHTLSLSLSLSLSHTHTHTTFTVANVIVNDTNLNLFRYSLSLPLCRK